MSANTGHIFKKRGWKVNKIYFNAKVDKDISWNSAGKKKFWVLLPLGKFPLLRSVVVLKSKNGKASFRVRRAGLKKNDRIYYCILLDDGKKVQLVHGNSPPVIIIR